MDASPWLKRSVHAASVIVAVFLLGCVLFFALGTLGMTFSDFGQAAEWMLLALPWLALLLGMAGIIKKVPYRVVLPVIAGCGALVFYLALDEAGRPPPPDLGVVMSPESDTYRVYRWYLKGDPQNRSAEQPKELAELVRLPSPPIKPGEWPGFVSKHRDVVERAWQQDQTGREWIEAMARDFPPGIFPPAGVHEPILDTSAVRASMRARWGHAHLLRLDGKPDESAKVLLPLLRAHYHLQRAGSATLSQLISIVAIRGTFDQLELLAEAGGLSPAARTEVVTVLREAPPVPLVIRNSFLAEEMFGRSTFDQMRHDYGGALGLVGANAGKLSANRFLGRLLFNPNRSEREYVECLHEARRLIELRQLTANEKAVGEFTQRLERWRLKNPVGRMLQMATPALGKAYALVWDAEDRRVALLRRLESPE